MLEVVDVGYAQESRQHKYARLERSFYQPTMAELNCDYAGCDDKKKIFAVADGVGHTPEAADAAQAVCRMFIASCLEGGSYPETARQVRHKINHGLLEAVHHSALMSRAATTLTGMVFTEDDTLTYLHVGDSQLLLCRDSHVIPCTSEQASPLDGSKLLNYLGQPGDWGPDIQRPPLTMTKRRNRTSHRRRSAEWGSIALREDDLFLLVTDGILGDRPHERLSYRQWQEAVSGRRPAQDIAESLVWQSRKIDDSTAVTVRIGRIAPTAFTS